MLRYRLNYALSLYNITHDYNILLKREEAIILPAS